MPNTAATALWPTAAAQIAARSKPRAVADRMIARGAPRTPTGTTPTSPRPSATEPTMKLDRPSMAGSPAIGPTTGGAGASWGAGCAVPSGSASRAVIGFAPRLRRPAYAGLMHPYALDRTRVFSL